MSVVTMKGLLEAGVHFGHRTRRWNPKMRPFIFTERSKIHIIDLQQTMLRINTYYQMVQDLVAQGGTVLFVGTKRQAQATIYEEANRCRMPYVNQRWLGGTLTNWSTIKQRIDYLLRLERRVDAGEFRNLSKKEQLAISREMEKLNRRLGGLKTMKDLPDLVFIVDTHLEDLAVKEANKLKIPILGMVDTNADPDEIDFVIPSNDDAIRAVKLIVSLIADAAEEGMRIREVEMVETGQVTEQELAEMEQYLGPSTLAKLHVSDDDDYEDYEEDDDYDDYEEDQVDEEEEYVEKEEYVEEDETGIDAAAEETPVFAQEAVAEEQIETGVAATVEEEEQEETVAEVLVSAEAERDEPFGETVAVTEEAVTEEAVVEEAVVEEAVVEEIAVDASEAVAETGDVVEGTEEVEEAEVEEAEEEEKGQ
jgi:small subunit ribosomal protein S2